MFLECDRIYWSTLTLQESDSRRILLVFVCWSTIYRIEMSKPFVSTFDSLGPSSVVREQGEKMGWNSTRKEGGGGYNSNSPLTWSVFRFPSEFELLGFYCRRNHDNKGTKLPPLPPPPPLKKTKRPGNPKCFDKKKITSLLKLPNATLAMIFSSIMKTQTQPCKS